MSKESGKKAAQYFIDKYPQYFFRDLSEPKVEAFTFKEVYDESMQFDEFDLQKCILRSDVNNAIICYNGLINQKIDISDQTRDDLLQLVCFYNSSDPVLVAPEERFFERTRILNKPTRSGDEKASEQISQLKSTWKDNGFAEQLFESIEEKGSRHYSALIQGMAKYGQTERAFSFYSKALESDMPLNVTTYNSLISITYNVHQTNEKRWKLVVELLQTMNENQIKPNLGTLNSTLKQVASYKFWNSTQEIARKVVNEFAFKYDIEPSLATYYHLLNTFYKSRYSKSEVIFEILNKINEKTLQIRDADDGELR